MIHVLVVDDSAFMRKALSMMLERDGEVRVVDTARDGQQALEKIQEYDPDVVTMDIEMPRMDGLTALRRIMDEAPRPVLMVSSLTQDGAAATVEAMEAGAVGFLPKQRSRVSLKITEIEDDLIKRIKSAAHSNMGAIRRKRGSRRRAASRRGTPDRLSFPEAQIITVGISTGGPFALQQVIPALPRDLPVPVVVVQHMPPHFTQSLANRLDASSALQVAEAEDGMSVEPGRVIIAAGGHHLMFRSGARHTIVKTPSEPSDTLHRPSVDVMFASAVEHYNGQVLGLIMTGMGKDGLEGATALKERGGRLIAQDEATSVVYGMPRAVAEAELTDLVLPMDDVAEALAHAVGAPTHSTAASSAPTSHLN
jgi:two-component system chemotaxis response regulator CheB